jgi:hypothetical protein
VEGRGHQPVGTGPRGWARAAVGVGVVLLCVGAGLRILGQGVAGFGR